MPQLDEKQIEHMKQLIGLSITYIADCDGCSEGTCPLSAKVIEHTEDLPALPAGITLCMLFDYITQNTYKKRKSET